MTIEVKQLVIKSSVSEQSSKDDRNQVPIMDLEAFKRELLTECKLIVSESLANARER
jgi:hypothetical protein